MKRREEELAKSLYIEENRLDNRHRARSTDRMISSRNDKDMWEMQNKMATSREIKDGIFKVRQNKEDEIENLMTHRLLNKKNTELLLQFLFDPKVSLEGKNGIISKLESECLINEDIIPFVFCEKMAKFCQDLLQKYCHFIGSFGHSNSKATQKAPPPKGLSLLNALTRLFSKVVSRRYVNDLPLITEEMTMMYCNTISVIARIINRIVFSLEKAAAASNISCKAYKISTIGSAQIVQKLTGINMPTVDSFIFASYYVILFGNRANSTKYNINEEIIQIQPPMDCTKDSNLSKNDLHSHKDFTEKSKVTIVRVCPPKYILMYMEEEWGKHLVEISSIIESSMEEDSSNQRNFVVGDFVGFAAKDGETLHNPLKSVPYLRGCVVSQYEGNVMLWTVDVGSWTFINQNHLIDLSKTCLSKLMPIISIGVLKGPVCNIDEDYLTNSFRILTGAIRRHLEFGGLTVLSSTGIHLFHYLEYLGDNVRIRFLDFLLQLCRSEDVVQHLRRRGLDIPLLGYFEHFAHILKNKLSGNDAKTQAEVVIISKILHSIIKINKDSNWYGINQATRTLLMLSDMENNWTTHYLTILKDLDVQDRLGGLSTRLNQSKKGQFRTSRPRNSTDSCALLNKGDNTKGDLYIGSKIDIHDNQSTQIMSGKIYEELDKSLLKETICALLNNNVDGFIYLGISSESLIDGIQMKDEDRNSLYKEVENILNNLITPAVASSDFRILYKEIQHRQAQRQHFLIQIAIHPQKNVLYFFHDEYKYFVRKGTENIRKILKSTVGIPATNEDCTPQQEVNTINTEREPQASIVNTSVETAQKSISDNIKTSFYPLDLLRKLTKK